MYKITKLQSSICEEIKGQLPVATMPMALLHCIVGKWPLVMFQSRGGVEYLLLTPDRCLIFPSVDYVRNLVTKHSIKQGIPVVIDCSHIYGADFTAAKVIKVNL